MKCLNLGLTVPYKGKSAKVQDILNDLTKVLGNKDAAYYVLSQNNGYPLERTRDGKVSRQFKSLKRLAHSDERATLLKAHTLSPQFMDVYGDYLNYPGSHILDNNGEPKLMDKGGYFYYVGNEGMTVPAKPNMAYPENLHDNTITDEMVFSSEEFPKDGGAQLKLAKQKLKTDGISNNIKVSDVPKGNEVYGHTLTQEGAATIIQVSQEIVEGPKGPYESEIIKGTLHGLAQKASMDITNAKPLITATAAALNKLFTDNFVTQHNEKLATVFSFKDTTDPDFIAAINSIGVHLGYPNAGELINSPLSEKPTKALTAEEKLAALKQRMAKLAPKREITPDSQRTVINETLKSKIVYTKNGGMSMGSIVKYFPKGKDAGSVQMVIVEAESNGKIAMVKYSEKDLAFDAEPVYENLESGKFEKVGDLPLLSRDNIAGYKDMFSVLPGSIVLNYTAFANKESLVVDIADSWPYVEVAVNSEPPVETTSPEINELLDEEIYVGSEKRTVRSELDKINKLKDTDLVEAAGEFKIFKAHYLYSVIGRALEGNPKLRDKIASLDLNNLVFKEKGANDYFDTKVDTNNGINIISKVLNDTSPFALQEYSETSINLVLPNYKKLIRSGEQKISIKSKKFKAKKGDIIGIKSFKGDTMRVALMVQDVTNTADGVSLKVLSVSSFMLENLDKKYNDSMSQKKEAPVKEKPKQEKEAVEYNKPLSSQEANSMIDVTTPDGMDITARLVSSIANSEAKGDKAILRNIATIYKSTVGDKMTLSGLQEIVNLAVKNKSTQVEDVYIAQNAGLNPNKDNTEAILKIKSTLRKLEESDLSKPLQQKLQEQGKQPVSPIKQPDEANPTTTGDEGDGQYVPKDMAIVNVPKSTKFEGGMSSQIQKAINDGIKTVTIKAIDGVAAVKDVLAEIDTMLTQFGYTKKAAGKFVFYTKSTEAKPKKEAPTKPAPTKASKVPVLKEPKKKEVFTIEYADITEGFKVDGNVVTINPKVINRAPLFYRLKELGKNVYIDSMDSKNIQVLKEMRKDVGYPDNLRFSEELKTALVEVEKSLQPKKVAKSITIRGVKIDMAALGFNFNLTLDQKNILNKYADWLDGSNEDLSFGIEGNAGSGKTTLLQVARQYAINANKSTAFSAMTHAATVNLEKKLGANAKTAHSLIGASPEVVENFPDQLNFTANVEELQQESGTVVFIDEITMADNAFMEQLLKMPYRYVFVGNMSQLPPVIKGNITTEDGKPVPKENTIAFNDKYTDVNRLTQIVRQSETNPAAMLFNRMSIGQHQPYIFPRFSNHNTLLYDKESSEGVYIINNQSTFLTQANAIMDKMMKKGDYTYGKLLTFTWARVDYFNDKIRKHLFGDNSGAPLLEGEPIQLTENIRNGRKGLPYKVTNLSSQKYGEMPFGQPAVQFFNAELVPGIKFMVNGKPGIPSVKTKIVPKTPQNEKFRAYREAETSKKWFAASKASGMLKKELTQEYLDYKNEFLYMWDTTGKTKTGKTYTSKRGISYGYATTIHQAQGSTYTYGLVDEAGIMGNSKRHFNANNPQESYLQYNRALYTAMTRASKLTMVLSNRTEAPVAESKDTKKAIDSKLDSEVRGVPGPLVKVSPTLSVREDSTEHDLFNVISTSPNKSKYNLVYAAANVAKEWRRKLASAVSGAIVVYSKETAAVQAAIKLQQAIENKEGPTEAGLPEDIYIHEQYDKYLNEVKEAVVAEYSSEDLISFHSQETLQTSSKNLMNELEGRIEDLTTRLNIAKDRGEKESTVQNISSEIKKIEGYMSDIRSRLDIDLLKKIAKEDLDSVDALLRSDNPDREAIQIAVNKLDLWMDVANMSNPKENPFLTADQMAEAKVQEDFGAFRARAENMSRKLNELGIDILHNSVNENLGTEIKKDSLFNLRSKVNWFSKITQSVAKVDNPIVAHIMMLINKANNRARKEAISESGILGDLFKKMKDSGFSEKLFWQRNEDGILTGNMTSRYTAKYYRTLNSAKKNDKTFKFIKNSSLFIDLFKVSKDPVAYLEEIAPLVGRDNAENAIAQAQENIEKFREIRRNYVYASFGKKFQDDLANLTPDQKLLYEQWNKKNDPITRTRAIENAESYQDLDDDSIADKYVVVLPRVEGAPVAGYHNYKGKVKESFYDENFVKIQSSPEAKALYEKAEAITRRAKQESRSASMSGYALGAVRKDLTDVFNANGIGSVTAKATADSMLSGITGSTDDRELGKRIPNEINSLEDRIRAKYYELKDLKYGRDKLTESQVKELVKESSDYVMSEYQENLFLALNNLNMATLSFKYKNAVKPQVDMAMHYADKMVPGETYGNNARSIDKEDVQKSLDMLNYFVDKELYGVPMVDKSYKFKAFGKYRSFEDKAKARELQSAIDILEAKPNPTAKDVSMIDQYKADLANIGEYVTAASALDFAMKYGRIVMLGWGYKSGFVNLLNGQLSNIIMSANGDMYGFEDLKKAYSVTVNSDDRQKMNKFIKNYDILGDILYDFKKANPFEKQDKWSPIKKAIKPFAAITSTEKLNQSVIMVAMMNKSKVTNNKTGETKSLWEAVDANGTLPSEYGDGNLYGTDYMLQKIQQITEQVAQTHGDYVNPKLIQSIPAGRAVTMFKMWFFDPVAVRFAAQKYNYVLGKETKGRYITLMDLFGEHRFNWLKDYSELKKSGRISELDQQNIRALITEAMIVVGLIATREMMRAMMCDNERDCGGALGNGTMNILNRLIAEMTTYLTPKGYFDLMDNPVAILRLFKNVQKIVNDTAELATQESTSEEWAGLGEDVLENLPFGRRIVMTEKGLEEVIQYQ